MLFSLRFKKIIKELMVLFAIVHLIKSIKLFSETKKEKDLQLIPKILQLGNVLFFWM